MPSFLHVIGVFLAIAPVAATAKTCSTKCGQEGDDHILTIKADDVSLKSLAGDSLLFGKSLADVEEALRLSISKQNANFDQLQEKYRRETKSFLTDIDEKQGVFVTDVEDIIDADSTERSQIQELHGKSAKCQEKSQLLTLSSGTFAGWASDSATGLVEQEAGGLAQLANTAVPPGVGDCSTPTIPTCDKSDLLNTAYGIIDDANTGTKRTLYRSLVNPECPPVAGTACETVCPAMEGENSQKFIAGVNIEYVCDKDGKWQPRLEVYSGIKVHTAVMESELRDWASSMNKKVDYRLLANHMDAWPKYLMLDVDINTNSYPLGTLQRYLDWRGIKCNVIENAYLGDPGTGPEGAYAISRHLMTSGGTLGSTLYFDTVADNITTADQAKPATDYLTIPPELCQRSVREQASKNGLAYFIPGEYEYPTLSDGTNSVLAQLNCDGTTSIDGHTSQLYAAGSAKPILYASRNRDPNYVHADGWYFRTANEDGTKWEFLRQGAPTRFEETGGAVGDGWSDTEVTSTDNGDVHGPWGGRDPVTKEFAVPGGPATCEISFRAWRIKTWDNEWFYFRVDGVEYWKKQGSGNCDQYGWDQAAARMPNGDSANSCYSDVVVEDIPCGDSAALSVEFDSSINQAVNDESWAFSDVVVAVSGKGSGATDTLEVHRFDVQKEGSLTSAGSNFFDWSAAASTRHKAYECSTEESYAAKPAATFTLLEEGCVTKNPIPTQCKFGSPAGCTFELLDAPGYKPGYLAAVRGGHSTTYSTDPHSCPVGWKIWAPRDKEDLQIACDAIDYSEMKSPHFIMDVTRPSNGCGGCTGSPMNSGSSAQSSWVTQDGQDWFMRDSNYGEPNGDYYANAWLSINNCDANSLTFNDLNANYNSNNYMCQPIGGA